MKPVEIQITAVSQDRISVSIDYHGDVRSVVRRWHADRSVIEAVWKDLAEIIEDSLHEPVTDDEASETREDIAQRLRSAGLTLFQEILKEECDRIRDLPVSPEAGQYLIFKIDRSLAHLPIEIMYDGHTFLSQKVAMGRLIYAEEVKAPPTEERPPAHTVVIVGDPSEDPVIRQDVEEEIDAVKRVFRKVKHSKLRIAVGSQVDQKFMLANLPGAMVFHFSGHGVVSDDENLTGIRLQGEKVLSGYSLQGLQNPPAVVFLNMCTAASGEGWKGSLGLVESFLRRGTKACMASLWDVRSKSATFMATCFYEHLLEGDTFGDALRKARLQAADRFGIHDPTWAAYALYGDPQLRLSGLEDAREEAPGVRRRLPLVSGLAILVALILFPLPTHKEGFETQHPLAVGYLLVESEPQDARVIVDGQEIGITPHTAELTVGNHKVAIEKEGYKRWEAWIEIEPSPRMVIQAYLETLE